jgi:MYXO-CTERM domain-containing protein
MRLAIDSRRTVLSALATATILLAQGAAWAVQRTYNLVQNSSTITISGNVSGNSITSQGTNNFGQTSLVARYSGSIIADRQVNTVNTFQFSGGSAIDAVVNGSWKPNSTVTSNSTSAADYGGKVNVSVGTVNMAGRNLVADLLSSGPPGAITNGQFNLGTSEVNLTAGSVDYWGFIDTIFGEIALTDVRSSYGLANQGGALSGTASISVQNLGGGMLRETLTVPIAAVLPPVSVSGYTINLTLNGSLLATSDFADNGERYWINPSSSAFATASNWNPGFTPAAAETAVFDLNSNHTVTFGASATNNRLRIEHDQVAFSLGTNTYSITNTSTTTPSIIAGAAAGDNGRLSLTGTGAGGTLSSVNAHLGAVASSTGQVTVGAGATWNNSLDLSVGRGGTGMLTITGGGKVVLPSGGTSNLGFASGSSGTATVTGSGSTWTNGQLYVGRSGSGTLNISSGGTVTSTTARIGFQATGGVTLTGSSTFTSTSTLFVGEQATGTLSVQSGSMLNTVTTNIGSSTGSNGTVTVTGSGSTWNNTGSAYVGGTSSVAGNQGTLNVNSSGNVTVGSTLRTWGLGTINLTSGKLKTGTLNIAQGTFSQTGGQLVATTVTGNLNRAGGTLTPGDTAAAGLTSISSSYTQQGGATLTMELGGTSTSQFDRVAIGGSVTLAGTLNVTLINGFMPMWGNSFQLLTAVSGRTGTFATVNLPTLTNSNLEWLTNYGPTSGSTFLTLSIGLKGDFNGDGVVNGADYVTWRNSGGTQADYNLWRSKFGVTASGSGSGSSGPESSATVPEPAAWALLAVAAIPLLRRGRRNC